MRLASVCFFIYITGVLTACSEPPKEKLKVADLGVIAAAISRSGQYAVVASTSHDMAVWDLKQKKYLRTWRHQKNKQANILAVDISNNDRFVLSADQKTVVLWDIVKGEALRYLAMRSPIQAIALGPNGQYALIGLLNHSAVLVNLQTGLITKRFKQGDVINAVALSNDGRYALTGSDDRYAVLWDLQTTKALYKWHHDKRVMFVGFSNNGQLAITASTQAPVNLWHTNTGKLKQQIDNKMTITSAYFTSNDSELALGVLPRYLVFGQLDNFSAHKQWTVPTLNGWRPSAALIYAIAKVDGQLLSIDSSGYVLWWGIE